MYPKVIDYEQMYELADSFLNLDTVRWSSVDDGTTGTNTANGVAGGEVSVVTEAADNGYHYMKSTAQIFKFADNKPLWFEARFSLTEANTDDANIVLGVSSVASAGILVNDGAGLATTFDGALFYKVDGTMTLKFGTSIGTTQTLQDICTFTSGVVYRVGFHFDSGDGTTGIITPYALNETTGIRYVGTPHNVAYAAAGVMNAIYGLKAGGANAETLKMDRFRVCAKI